MADSKSWMDKVRENVSRVLTPVEEPAPKQTPKPNAFNDAEKRRRTAQNLQNYFNTGKESE